MEQADEGGQGSPGQLAIFDALLTGLVRGKMPDDEAVRGYVVGLAKATDEENKYEQATLEHNAFAELVRALTARREADSQ